MKPLEGVKFAGYVGCQTNRPFGIAGESFENPMYLDKLVETVGGEALTEYEQKVTCCGGALAFSEPEKSQKQIKDIVESAYDHGADMIVTPCPLCQANVEVYQSEINRKQGTKLQMPVLYYSQLMTVAYGGTASEAGLDGHIIRATKLEEIAGKDLAHCAVNSAAHGARTETNSPTINDISHLRVAFFMEFVGTANCSKWLQILAGRVNCFPD